METHVPDRLTVRGDAALIRRALANLLDNELSHAPPGTTVTVVMAVETNAVSLEIDDDGSGFPPDVSGRLFQRFAKGATSRGHGLGLAFVRAVALAHGGSVAAGNRTDGARSCGSRCPLLISSWRDGRMRVMIATETYAPVVNGPAVFTRRLAVGLVRRGHEVTVIAPSPGRQFRVEGTEGNPRVVRIPSIPTPYPVQRCALLTARGASAVLRRFRPEVVHVQNHFVLGHAFARAAHACGIPVVGTSHFVPENMLPHAPGVLLRAGATRQIVRRALWQQVIRFYEGLDAVTVPSRAAAALARARGMQAPVYVISNGVDTIQFCPAPPDEPVGGPWRSKGPVVLYVGRLDVDKGLETATRAMPIVTEREPAALVLCGRGVHESALRRLSRSLGVDERVRFIGFVGDEDLPALYRTAAVFVMPSANELQSLATLEAMASGLPIVAADALALPELVADGANGFLFPPGDHRALADRILRVMADPDARMRMGTASRSVAVRHHIEGSLAAFERLYSDVAIRGPDRHHLQHVGGFERSPRNP